MIDKTDGSFAALIIKHNFMSILSRSVRIEDRERCIEGAALGWWQHCIPLMTQAATIS